MDTSPSQGKSKRPSRQTRRQTSNHTVPINPRRKFKRRGTGDFESKFGSSTNENEMHSSTSESEELEMDAVESDVDMVDEESGLTGEERRKHIQQKMRQNRLDARIAGENALSEEERRAADKHVVRKLVVNAILIGLWYFFSLSISIYNKWMFSSDHLDFHFPLFTTSLHMLVQFILASSILAIFPSLRPRQPAVELMTSDSFHQMQPSKPLMTPLFYFTRLVPTGTTTSLDIGLGNASLRFITLTFYTMCKSSVLIFVLMFAFLFRLEAPSWRLILIILTMTLGVLMMVFGETAFNALGFALAISASFFSGFRWALTQILLLHHPATSNPFATIFFLAPIMFLTLFTIALFSETPASVIAGLNILVEKEGMAKAVTLMFIPGVLAFCMISAEFSLLQRTNVVTLSICGIFKEVVTISAAGIVFHDELSFVNLSGLFVTIGSIASYNYLKVTKMRQEAREKVAKKVDDEDEHEGIDSERARNGHAVSGGISSAPRKHKRRRSRIGVDEGTNVVSDGANVPLMHEENPNSTSSQRGGGAGGGAGGEGGGGGGGRRNS